MHRPEDDTDHAGLDHDAHNGLGEAVTTQHLQRPGTRCQMLVRGGLLTPDISGQSWLCAHKGRAWNNKSNRKKNTARGGAVGHSYWVNINNSAADDPSERFPSPG